MIVRITDRPKNVPMGELAVGSVCIVLEIYFFKDRMEFRLARNGKVAAIVDATLLELVDQKVGIPGAIMCRLDGDMVVIRPEKFSSSGFWERWLDGQRNEQEIVQEIIAEIAGVGA